MLLQLTGVFENSFKINWSFDPLDGVNIKNFKIRWCKNPSCAMLSAAATEWVEIIRPHYVRRSFTVIVESEPVYSAQIVAEAISDKVPVPSLSVDREGKT